MERIAIREAAGRRFALIAAAAASFIVISLITLVGFNYYQGTQKAQYAKNNQNASSIASVIGYYDVIDYSNIY